MTIDQISSYMADVAVSQSFRFFWIPLLTAGLSIFINKASKNDVYAEHRKEDFFVGLQLALASLLGSITYSVYAAQRIISAGQPVPDAMQPLQAKFIMSPILVASLILGLWGVSHSIRKFGWKNEREMNWFFGIIFPFLYGIFSLVVVVIWIGATP